MIDTRLVHGEISYHKKNIKNFSTNKFSWNILQHKAYFFRQLNADFHNPFVFFIPMLALRAYPVADYPDTISD